MDGSQDRRWTKRWRVALVAAVLAVAALAIPALGAPTKDVTVDPDAAAGAPGFTDLETLTYAQAKARIDQLDEITLPVAVEGLELIDVSGVTLGSNDAGRSLSLSGSASLPALHGGSQDVDLLVTAVWPDDASTEPAIAITARTDDLSLSEINPLWDDAYGEVTFATARLAVASADHELEPDALPEAARDFYPEATALVGGVNFAGDLELGGRLEEAFGYAGYSGEVSLEGSLGASAAALFGTATDAELGALRLQATLGKSPTAPEWIADRTSTFAFVLDEGRPGLSVDEDVTVALDGTMNRFQGRVAIAPEGAIEAEVALVGALDAPFGLDGLDPSKLSDIALRLALDEGTVEGGLAFGVDVEGTPVQVTAGFVTGGGTTRADFAIEGALTVPTLVSFAGDVLGTPVAEVPGTDDVSLDKVSFSFTTGAGERIFSVGADATVKQLQAAAVLTLRTSPGQPAQPLLGLRLTDPGCDSDCIRMSSLLPADQAGEVLAGLQLPALNLTVAPASLSELAAEDLTPQEAEFFGETYETLPDTLAFAPGVNLQGRLPVDALGADVREGLGFPAGSEVVLSGTLGADVTLSRLNGGSSLSLRELALEAVLPAASESTVLPDWVEPSGPTTLGFRYETGGIAVSFDTAADVTIDGSTFATTIAGRLERAGRRTSIAFAGTIEDWQQPFGVSWIDSIDEATVELDTSFGGGQPATLDAAVTAATVLGGKRFELEFGLSKDVSTSASLTARFADTAALSEIAGLFPELSGMDLDAALDELSIGPVAVSLTVGGAASSFELTARTSFRDLTSDLLISARPGGAFTLGIKARGTVELGDLVADAPKLTLPGAALVLGSEAGTRPVAQLTEGEFDFYKTLYGCEADDEPADCTDFARLELTRGLELLAAFELGDDVEQMASEIGIQTSGSALLTGRIPVFGGTDFALRASLGNFRFDEQPDWYERGDVALEIGANGLRFAGSLDVKIQREGDQWMPECEGGVIRSTFVDGEPAERCYDLLNFEIGARFALQPSPSFTLTGALKTTSPWRNAFGQDWLEIRRVALQLGVTLPPTGPEVTMGFQGDIKIGSKDIAAALKVGLAPIPGPPFVRPNLIGFSAASRAGIALSDLVWLNNQITGGALAVEEATMPDVSLRNLFLQYSQQTDVDLCLTAGVRFNADLYVGTDLPGAGGDDDPSGCRTIDTDPETRQSCIERKSDGCLASVYGRFDAGGLQAGGELSGFDLGPISFDDSLVELSLTPSRQRVRLKGGVRIGTGSYEFAKGRADLDFSRDGFFFSGDAAIFNDAFHGYLEANAPFDLQNPSFRVKAWLRADARGALNGLVGEKAENVRPVVVALGSLLEMITGSGSVPNVRDLPGLLQRAGVPVPGEVRTMTDTLGTAQDQIQRYAGPVLTLQPLLKGFSINVPGIPGFYTERTCITVVKNGTCYFTPPFGLIPGIPGTWVPGTCVNTVVDGTCYFTPPFGVTVPGICAALGIPSASADCSWAGLMRRFVQPALIAALEKATGLDFAENTFEDAITTLVDRFADGAGSIINIDCAYFSADATGLARGDVDVDLATRLRLFDHPLEFGASWDFRVRSGSPDAVLAGIFRSLFSPSATTCPAVPAGHEEVRDDIPSRRLTATLTPSVADEAGEVTLTGTFDDGSTDYPAVQVDWGDGSTSSIPAGGSQTVSATHRYANDGNYPVTAIVQDAGAHAQQLSATVRNVAPSLTALAGEPAPSDEHGVVTLRGAFADPGTQDRHDVRIDWGDGSEPTRHTVAAGARTFALEHRYLDDPARTITAVVTDDDGGSASRTAAAEVRNVAPSGIRVTPLAVVAAEGEPPPPGGPVDVTEGAIVTYGIDFDDPGTLDTHRLTVDWGDGDAPQTIEVGAGTRHVELPHRFLDDGTFDVRVAVTDDDGGQGAGISPVHVGNVAPEVTAVLDDDSLAEGDGVRIEGSIKDPGLLDSHTVVIDWGAGRTDADRYQSVAVAAGERTFAATKRYGDDGTFTIAPVVTDDDGGEGRAALPLTVANLAPAIAIDPAGSVGTPGGRTFIARAGGPLELRARATDAGSDDLAVTWTWRDGATTVTDHLSAPPAADPDPSPQSAPRDLVDVQRHAWAAPCLYEDVVAGVADDDGGEAADRVDVVVTGTADSGEGNWQREYDPRKAPRVPEATLLCYLRIAGQMSAVFGEARALTTRADAYDVLNPGPGANSELDKLDRELLGAWLDFAHGALRHGAIAAVLRDAEATRLDPAATKKDLQRARQEVSGLRE